MFVKGDRTFGVRPGRFIRAVRVAAMDPLGGIGDAIFWFTLVPITAGITANMAIGGSIVGGLLGSFCPLSFRWDSPKIQVDPT